jgi:hypothetical protein
MDLGSLSPFAHLAPPRPQLKCVAARPSIRHAGSHAAAPAPKLVRDGGALEPRPPVPARPRALSALLRGDARAGRLPRVGPGARARGRLLPRWRAPGSLGLIDRAHLGGGPPVPPGARPGGRASASRAEASRSSRSPPSGPGGSSRWSPAIPTAWRSCSSRCRPTTPFAVAADASPRRPAALGASDLDRRRRRSARRATGSGLDRGRRQRHLGPAQLLLGQQRLAGRRGKQALGGGGLATDRRGTPEEAEDAAAGGQGSRDPVRARPLTAVARGAYTEGVPLMVRRSGSHEEMPR